MILRGTSRSNISSKQQINTYEILTRRSDENMAARNAITLVRKSKASAPEFLQLRCHITPGASKVREGVAAVTDECIEICVSAQPQDGKSNKAVLELLSEVNNLSCGPKRIVNGNTIPGPRCPKIRSANHTWDEEQGQNYQHRQRLLPARKEYGWDRGYGILSETEAP